MPSKFSKKKKKREVIFSLSIKVFFKNCGRVVPGSQRPNVLCFNCLKHYIVLLYVLQQHMAHLIWGGSEENSGGGQGIGGTKWAVSIATGPMCSCMREHEM